MTARSRTLRPRRMHRTAARCSAPLPWESNGDADVLFLHRNASEERGRAYDRIVDRGGRDVIERMRLLWPTLRPGGFYILERVRHEEANGRRHERFCGAAKRRVPCPDLRVAGRPEQSYSDLK